MDSIHDSSSVHTTILRCTALDATDRATTSATRAPPRARVARARAAHGASRARAHAFSFKSHMHREQTDSLLILQRLVLHHITVSLRRLLPRRSSI